MSDTATNVLTGFQATSSKGGELLGDGGSLFGETSEDTAVSFSSVLNQAQSNQADGSDFDEQSTRLARETGSDESVHDRNKLPLEENRGLRPEPRSAEGQGRTQSTHRSSDSQDAMGIAPVAETPGQLEEATEPSDTVKSTVATRVSSENLDVETTDPHLVVHDNGRKTPEHLATQVPGPELQVSAVPSQPARPDVTLESSNDVELNLATRQSTALSENLTAGQSPRPASTTIVDVPPITPVASSSLSETVAAAATADSGPSNAASVLSVGVGAQGSAAPGSAAPGSTAPGSTAPVAANPSLSVETDADQPVVSAAVFANRLNAQPVATVNPTVMQPAPVDSAADTVTDAEQLTTIAGIQSLQAGISGLAQTASNATAATSGVATLESASSTMAPLAPVTVASATSAGLTSDQGGQPKPAELNPVTTGVNPALTLASNIPPTNTNTPPASQAMTNGSANTLLAETTVDSPLGMTAPAAAAVKDSASAVSINPMLDNMLSTPASGIVTAPILAKADLTGTPVAQTPLNVPLLTPAAPEAMAGNVRWMVGEGVQNAVVNVSPNGMGPISVQIGIEKEQMSISIVASQANTREALESMLPRLRDQLSAQGVETVRVDISDGRGDRSGSFSGFERQNMGYTTADSQQNSQQRNTDARDSESHSAELSESKVNDSGERTLSESERALVDQLKSSSTNSSVKNVSISHGYDLYV